MHAAGATSHTRDTCFYLILTHDNSHPPIGTDTGSGEEEDEDGDAEALQGLMQRLIMGQRSKAKAKQAAVLRAAQERITQVGTTAQVAVEVPWNTFISCAMSCHDTCREEWPCLCTCILC